MRQRYFSDLIALSTREPASTPPDFDPAAMAATFRKFPHLHPQPYSGIFHPSTYLPKMDEELSRQNWGGCAPYFASEEPPPLSPPPGMIRDWVEAYKQAFIEEARKEMEKIQENIWLYGTMGPAKAIQDVPDRTPLPSSTVLVQHQGPNRKQRRAQRK